MRITVLGSGTSQGVPVIACPCEVCCSANPKDKRLRSSILLEENGETYCIDTGPDFRQQMLRHKVTSLRGVLYTHEHKDHLAGMDDVRAFNFFEGRPMRLYCSERVEEALRREYSYVFSNNGYPGIPSVEVHRIENKPFTIERDLRVVPIEVLHHRMPVFGFRFGAFCYITDAKTIADEELEKVKGCKILIVNALRKEEHISHFNLEQALDFIEKVKPEQAYLTHISHVFGLHEEIEALLPPNVGVCYDGMVLEV